jgi:hypothetical protein
VTGLLKKAVRWTVGRSVGRAGRQLGRIYATVGTKAEFVTFLSFAATYRL